MKSNVKKRFKTGLMSISLVLLILSSFSHTSLANETILPDLGDASGTLISPAEELKLGKEFMRQARRQLKFLDDPELQQYISGLGNRIASQSNHIQHPFSFYIIDNTALNAFAVPGGFIVVHTGLILNTDSEAQLASVLAHEVAHINQRHIPRMLVAQEKGVGTAMLGIFAALLLFQAGEIEGGEAAIAFSTAGLAQQQLNFTRTHEEEADRLGIELLVGAGFDARAMPRFFKKMLNWSRLYDTNLPEFLQTHPLTTRRIAETQDRAERYTARRSPDSSAFHHIRAKIRARSEEQPATAVARFAANLKQKRYANKNSEEYGYAIALMRNHQFKKARTIIRKLRLTKPDQINYQVIEAENELLANNIGKALKLIGTAYEKAPTNTALQSSYAKTLIRAKKHKKASKLLKIAIKQRPVEPSLHKLLAQAAGSANEKLKAHQALAEYHYLIGEPIKAVKQLQLAIQFAGENKYLKAGLQARIQELQGASDQKAKKSESH
jgi:predicted Zn-dependent protease